MDPKNKYNVIDKIAKTYIREAFILHPIPWHYCPNYIKAATKNLVLQAGLLTIIAKVT